MTHSNKAIIYTRFSPRRDADKSESCEMQVASCEQYAYNKGMEIQAIYNDPDAKGADECREKLWAAIGALKPGWTLIVYKADRLARNLYLSEKIRMKVGDRGAHIEAVTGDVQGDGPEVIMVRQIMAAMAEYDRKQIGIRTRWAMKDKTKRGNRMGRYAPYGWIVPENYVTGKRGGDHPMVINHDEMRCVQLIKSMKGFPINKIRRIMQAQEPGGCRGKKWQCLTIKRILERDYAGMQNQASCLSPDPSLA